REGDEVEILIKQIEVDEHGRCAGGVAEIGARLGHADGAAFGEVDYERRKDLGSEAEVITPRVRSGIPEVGALEGVDVLGVAEVGAAPDPVMVLKEGRLDGE